MGVDLNTYRSRIGCFSQPNKNKLCCPILNLSQIPLCIRLLLFTLLCVQGIESNPGPDTRGATGRGTPRGRGSNKGNNYGRGRNHASSDTMEHRTTSDFNNKARYPLRDKQQNAGSYSNAVKSTVFTTPSTHRQPDLNQWLNDSQTQPPSSAANTDDQALNNSVASDASTVLTDLTDLGQNVDHRNIDSADFKSLLLEIRSDVKSMNAKFDTLDRAVSLLKSENVVLKEQNEMLASKVDSLTQSIDSVREMALKSELKNERLEAQSRRDNLKFHGIAEDRDETWDQTEAKVKTEISKLGLDPNNISIERAHRLPGRSSPRTIIAKFSFFKDRESVLRSYRDQRKRENGNSQRSGVRIVEDFPERVTRQRSALYPLMRDSIREKKTAYYRYDKLVVDGVLYSFDYEANRPVRCDK